MSQNSPTSSIIYNIQYNYTHIITYIILVYDNVYIYMDIYLPELLGIVSSGHLLTDMHFVDSCMQSYPEIQLLIYYGDSSEYSGGPPPFASAHFRRCRFCLISDVLNWRTIFWFWFWRFARCFETHAQYSLTIQQISIWTACNWLLGRLRVIVLFSLA